MELGYNQPAKVSKISSLNIIKKPFEMVTLLYQIKLQIHTLYIDKNRSSTLNKKYISTHSL